MKNSMGTTWSATPHANANGDEVLVGCYTISSTTDSDWGIMLVKNNSKKRSIVSWIRFVKLVMTVDEEGTSSLIVRNGNPSLLLVGGYYS